LEEPQAIQNSKYKLTITKQAILYQTVALLLNLNK
jgi:hypothetical protein